jgi:hypothetical protein
MYLVGVLPALLVLWIWRHAGIAALGSSERAPPLGACTTA